MRKITDNERGAVTIIIALSLMMLLGMMALGVEAGRWYLVKAELSKAVDAAAFAGAKNISNPYITDKLQLAEEFGNANFSAGYIGTPETGAGAVSFTATMDANAKQFTVTGATGAINIFSCLFGENAVNVQSSGVAIRNDVDIMLVLDRTGSMAGIDMTNLKTAARAFVNFFKDTQDNDRLGLISYAVGPTLDFALGNNYYSPITTAINNMSANGYTDIADALARSIQLPGGLPDQSGLAPDQKRKQYVILFTDGVPNIIRSRFLRNNQQYDAVARCSDNYCAPGSGVYIYLLNQTTGNNLGACTCVQWSDPTHRNCTSWSGLCTRQTGDGVNQTTRWDIFYQDDYHPPGYSSPYSNIPGDVLATYIKNTSRALSVKYATDIKNRDILIYTIGLGADADQAFLRSLSSESEASERQFFYYAPSSGELTDIFQAIAKEIRLRLVR